MKIGFTGLDIPEGKIKYQDKVLISLANKDKPKKISPFFVEFLKDEYLDSDAIVIQKDFLLDILIVRNKHQIDLFIVFYFSLHHNFYIYRQIPYFTTA